MPEPQKTQDLVSVEVSGLSASLLMTHGSISLWFGRSAAPSLVSRVIRTIARIDCAAEHERVIICDFDEIGDFEGRGYVLTSYARSGDMYRAVFVVPFSREEALDLFIDSILDAISRGDVSVSLRWRGGPVRMRALCEELKRLNYFTRFISNYRTDE